MLFRSEQMVAEDAFTDDLAKCLVMATMVQTKIRAGEYREALRYALKHLITQKQTKTRNTDGDTVREELQEYQHMKDCSIHWLISFIYRCLGNRGAALRNYEKCGDILSRCKFNDPYAIAVGYMQLGSVYEYQEQHEKALEYQKKSLAILHNFHGHVNHPQIATAYWYMGSVYRSQEKYEKALECFKKSLKIRIAAFGDVNNSLIASSYRRMGEVYFSQGKYDKALECLKKQLAIERAVYGNVNCHCIATIYSNMDMVYQSQGEYEKALEFFEEFSKLSMEM